MSDKELDMSEQEEPDVSEETKRLMDEAMSKADTTLESDVDDDIPKQANTTTTLLDETFENIKERIEGLILEIEDSTRSTEPQFNERMALVLDSLSSRLRSAGLGIFTNTAIKIVNDELSHGVNGSAFLSPIYETISETMSRVEDIITKTHRGALKSLTFRTSDLQGRIVQNYARLNEMETELASTKTELSKWRARSRELDEIIRRSEESIEAQNKKAQQQQEVIDELQNLLTQREEAITVLRGELSQSQAHIEQLQQMIEKLDNAEEIVSDYEDKIMEISRLEGQITEQLELIAQRNSSIDRISAQIEQLQIDNAELETKFENLKRESSMAIGIKDSLEDDVSKLNGQLEELRARWDLLYQVAEDEPAFKAYFLVAGRDTTWLPLSHLSSALGIPSVALRRQLQKFIDAGLIEIDDDKIRPRTLSEVSETAKELDKQILKEAESELTQTRNDKTIEDAD